MTLGAVLVLAALHGALAPRGWPGPILKYGGDTEGGAPYSFYDPDHPTHLVGLDVEIAEEIARRVKAKPEFFQDKWDSLIPSLNRGDCELVVNGIEVTPDRAKVIDFSRPYLIFQEELTVRATETGIASLAELSGHKVGTLSGSLAREVLVDVKGAEIVTYDDVLEPYQDLALGRVDAVLLDEPIAAYYAHPDARLKVAGPPIAQGLYAVAVRKGDLARLEAVDAALGAMFEDGTLQKILERWGLWSGVQEELAMGRALTDLYSAKTAYELSGLAKSLKAAQAPTVHKPKSFLAYFPLLLQGAGMTLFLSVAAFALAVLVGLPLALARAFAPPLVQAISVAYIEAVRGTPLLLQLYVLYYGMASVGVTLPALVAAILGLGLNYAAYEAEVYRSAIGSVPLGQTEAALSLGMSRAQALRHVILPQALRVAMPPSTNDFIALFKDSSLVSVITVVELTKQFSIAAAATYSYAELGLMTAALYLAMSLPMSLLARNMERRLAAASGAA